MSEVYRPATPGHRRSRPWSSPPAGKAHQVRCACATAVLALVGTLLLAPGCVFDASIPGDAEAGSRIACQGAADCPAGWFCNAPTGHCVADARRDNVPPALVGLPALSPTVGGLGQLFVLDFEVTEPLGQDPVVQLAIGGGRVARLALDPGGSDRAGLRYRYTYQAAGHEEEGSRLLTIDLRDRAGNQVEDLSGGSLLLDFTAPRLTAVVLAPAIARAGVTVELAVETSEALPEVPALTFVDGQGETRSFRHDASPTTTRHLYTYAADGAERDGVYALRASGRDLAGNGFAAASVALLTLDFTPPALRSAWVVPERAAAGQRVDVEAELDEEIASLDGLGAEPLTGAGSAHLYAAVASSRRRLRFEHVVDAGSDGEYALSLRALTDRAGNVATALAVGKVTYDTTPPALLAFAASHSRLLAEQTLTVTFATDEPLGVEPVVMLGPVRLARAGSGTTPHTYRLPAAGTQLVGTYALTLQLTDLVQNTATLAPAEVVVDAVPPTLVDLVFSPPSARLDSTVLLSVTASEPLGAPPQLVWASPAGDPGFAYLGSSGLGHLWALEVDAGVVGGAYQVIQVTLVDAAGNQTVVDLAGAPPSLDVDTVAPAIQNLASSRSVFSAQDRFDSGLVWFDAYDPVGAGTPPDPADPDNAPVASVEVRLAGQRLDCLPRPVLGVHRHECLLEVGADLAEGLQILAVRATDRAGNESSASLAVRLDFTAPAVVPGTVELQLVAPPGCPHDEVTAWTADATARVLFVLDEPVGAIPTVATTPPAELRFAHGSGAVTSFAFSRTLEPGEATAQGACNLVARVVDAVGNRATLALEPALPLVIDTEAPAAPDVDTEGGVVYARAPWGLDEDRSGTLSPPLYRIATGVEVVDAETTRVVALDGPDPASASVIGSARAAAGRFEAMALNRADRSDVYLVAHDEACNPSPARRVRAVTWTATLGRKVPGSTLANPHVVGRAPRLWPSLYQGELWAELGASELPAVHARDAVTTRSATGAYWSDQLFSGALPTAISGYAMAFDTARGRAVLFGIYGGTSDTWEWDGTRWTKREPLGAVPEARYGHGMAYDSARDRTVLFGGYHTSTKWNDTWEWDGDRWSQRATSGTRPSARSGPGMAYDSARGVVVLFGGDDLYFNQQRDTWEWDGIAWRRVPTTGTVPIAREYPAMAYDSDRQVVVLIGGNSDSAGRLDDVWEWDGATWSEVVPIGPRPPPRSIGAMAYDSVRGVMVIFGGFTSTSTRLNDTWEWDGESWHQRLPSGTLPRARASQVMAYDSVRGRVLLFGGNGSGATGLNDTWEWDGSAWTDRTPTGQIPAARYLFAMAYDSARQRAVVFGGSQSGSSTAPLLGDTWEWNGTTWREIALATAAPRPTARWGHAMAYDSVRGRSVLCGGRDTTYLSDVWEWDGTAWSLMLPTGGAPPARYYHALAFDEARGRTVLFGGQNASGLLDDTWEWDGSSWFDVTPTANRPAARIHHAMAHDRDRGVVVLFGGEASSALGDTWEWDGTSWTRITPSSGSPSSRGRHAMAYDTARQRTVLFGGRSTTNSGYRSDTWEWDGGRWTLRTSAGNATLRHGHAMVYAAGQGRILCFGGQTGYFGQTNDTFLLPSGIDDHPVATLSVNTSVAAVESGAVVGSVEVLGFAGGVGYPAGVSTAGVELLLWDQGAWLPIDASSAGVTTPDLVSFSSSDAALFARLRAAGAVHLALRTAAPAGVQTAEVALDYVELTMRYRLP